MAYKVVVRQETTEGKTALVSCRVFGEACTTYELGKWIRPIYGPSLVFKKLNDAIRFSERTLGKYDIIYRCKTTELNEVVSLLTGRDASSFRAFWLDLPLDNSVTLQAPTGTYSAKRVMLTKEVWTTELDTT